MHKDMTAFFKIFHHYNIGNEKNQWYFSFCLRFLKAVIKKRKNVPF